MLVLLAHFPPTWDTPQGIFVICVSLFCFAFICRFQLSLPLSFDFLSLMAASFLVSHVTCVKMAPCLQRRTHAWDATGQLLGNFLSTNSPRATDNFLSVLYFLIGCQATYKDPMGARGHSPVHPLSARHCMFDSTNLSARLVYLGLAYLS